MQKSIVEVEFFDHDGCPMQITARFYDEYSLVEAWMPNVISAERYHAELLRTASMSGELGRAAVRKELQERQYFLAGAKSILYGLVLYGLVRHVDERKEVAVQEHDGPFGLLLADERHEFSVLMRAVHQIDVRTFRAYDLCVSDLQTLGYRPKTALP